jgi:hypothetical protein
VNIQVPEPSYTYYLNQNFHFSAFARYENDIFLLPDDLIRINENNLYLRTTIILAGASASARIWNGLWGKLQVGRTLKTRTTILDRSFGTQSELGRPQGTFLQGGLSWRFQ